MPRAGISAGAGVDSEYLPFRDRPFEHSSHIAVLTLDADSREDLMFSENIRLVFLEMRIVGGS